MSNDEKTPEYGICDPTVQADELTRNSIATKLINQAHLHGVTSLYLGIFCISPFLYVVFENWSFLPASVIALFVLWRVQVLRKAGINAKLLPVAASLMLVLSVAAFFAYPPIRNNLGNHYFDTHPLIALVYVVLITGLVLLLLVFAVTAIICGVRSKRIANNAMSNVGIILGSIYIICWVVLVSMGAMFMLHNNYSLSDLFFAQ